MKQLLGGILLLCAGCHSVPDSLVKTIIPSAGVTVAVPAENLQDDIHFSSLKVPPAPVILGKKQIPVLCYHQIRDWKTTDSKVSRTYIVPPAAFAMQMQDARRQWLSQYQPGSALCLSAYRGAASFQTDPVNLRRYGS